MPGVNPDLDLDAQDQAEVFDEDNYNTDEQLGEMRTFEEAPDVLDVTAAPGDGDDDESLPLDTDAFEAEAFDDQIALGDDDEEVLSRVAGAEGADEIAAGASENLLDEALDDGLEQTFPASDPISITRRED